MKTHLCVPALGLTALLLQIQCVTAATLHDCAALRDDGARLRCYDSLAGRQQADPGTPAAESGRHLGRQQAPAPAQSRLDTHWELGDENKRGVFNLVGHRPNYLLATHNRSPNNTPYLPLFALDPDADGLSRFELAYQLGFKVKVVEKVQGSPVDLWFGYTQRSFWQASNRKASSPFRETNYEPEVMAVMPVNWGSSDLKLKFLALGLNHQSNGQADLLSRSWNRAYLQAGMEIGGLSVLLRTWRRFEADDDDNPDILRYMGRGDVIASLHRGGHDYEVMARFSPDSGKGALQLGWSFPLAENLKGYVQYFSGYGYSLIDYNAFQRVLGAGIRIGF